MYYPNDKINLMPIGIDLNDIDSQEDALEVADENNLLPQVP